MKAAIIESYGNSENLKIGRIAQPSIASDEVLVNVRAIGINPIDWKMREGKFARLHSKKFPMVLGTDFAGIVYEVGKNVKDYKKGDRVFSSMPAMKGQGAYAEYVKTVPDSLAKVPEGLSFEQVAAIPIAGLTALQGLQGKCGIQKDMHVLINGASGGVGHFAVQLAKHFKAEVTGVCSDRNADFIQTLGADHVINYKETDFTKDTKAQYDIVFDAIAGRSFGECKPVMKTKSTYLNTIPSPKRFMRRALTSFSGKKLKTIVTNINPEELSILTKMMGDKKLKVHLDKTYPFDEIRAAHDYSQSGRVRGKIVVTLKESK